MKTKKVQNPVQKRFQEVEENRIINSCVNLKSLNYEEICFSEISPVEGEEDNWWDSYICPTSRKNRRSR